jgi:hypothetical protein
MSDADVNHLSVLMEHVIDQNRAVLEAVGDMQQKVATLPTMQQDIAELKQDVRVIKAAVTDLSRDIEKHKSLPVHLAHGHA